MGEWTSQELSAMEKKKNIQEFMKSWVRAEEHEESE